VPLADTPADLVAAGQQLDTGHIRAGLPQELEPEMLAARADLLPVVAAAAARVL
jgi:hypothetical protein